MPSSSNLVTFPRQPSLSNRRNHKVGPRHANLIVSLLSSDRRQAHPSTSQQAKNVLVLHSLSRARQDRRPAGQVFTVNIWHVPKNRSLARSSLNRLRIGSARQRPEVWGKNRKIDVPHQGGGVLVVGDVTKHVGNSTAASIRARKWKSAARMIQKAKT